MTANACNRNIAVKTHTAHLHEALYLCTVRLSSCTHDSNTILSHFSAPFRILTLIAPSKYSQIQLRRGMHTGSNGSMRPDVSSLYLLA